LLLYIVGEIAVKKTLQVLRYGVDAYDRRSVELQWSDKSPIELYADKLNLPQFALIAYGNEMCAEEYKTGNIRRISTAFCVNR